MTRFIQEVPTKTGYYSTNELGEIDNLVFTENNEIAYICSWDRSSSNNFIETILVKMFQNYPSIFFEADDTDWMAYQLLSYFKINKITVSIPISFQTKVKTLHP